MKRYLEAVIAQDLNRKMVFLSGPRQVGKTTLAEQLLEQSRNGVYLNFDTAADRKIITSQTWDPAAGLLVFDELHKMPKWKSWLKGVYDGKPKLQQILVTGSARLDYLKKSGDSLAGRFFGIRLHPISVAEWCVTQEVSNEIALSHLLERGGFPEAMLTQSIADSERWRLQYLDGLIREDILEFSRLHEINTLRVLVDLLRERVASPLSVASLARDLSASTTTIARYIQVLEALHIVFMIRPWHKNIARSLLKTPKLYFYDSGLVRGGEGVKFENLVANHLLKWSHFQRDVFGIEMDLHYLRTRDEAEVDFALVEAGSVSHLIECKLGDTKMHPALSRFAAEHGNAKATQLVRHGRKVTMVDGVSVAPAADWLGGLI
jgi:uncharacterized protein